MVSKSDQELSFTKDLRAWNQIKSLSMQSFLIERSLILDPHRALTLKSHHVLLFVAVGLLMAVVTYHALFVECVEMAASMMVSSQQN